MADKPKHASDYKSEQVELVRAMCLYVATKLGDMMDDLLIVGGLVPSLIIDQEHLGEDVEPHVGTMDLDVGLQIALLNEGRYRQLTERLRDAGFEMDQNAAGSPTRQRWVIANAERVTIDFLIQPTLEGDKGGRLRDIEPDFAETFVGGHRRWLRDGRAEVEPHGIHPDVVDKATIEVRQRTITAPSDERGERGEQGHEAQKGDMRGVARTGGDGTHRGTLSQRC